MYARAHTHRMCMPIHACTCMWNVTCDPLSSPLICILYTLAAQIVDSLVSVDVDGVGVVDGDPPSVFVRRRILEQVRLASMHTRTLQCGAHGN